jgi:hypothetical protein
MNSRQPSGHRVNLAGCDGGRGERYRAELGFSPYRLMLGDVSQDRRVCSQLDRIVDGVS